MMSSETEFVCPLCLTLGSSAQQCTLCQFPRVHEIMSPKMTARLFQFLGNGASEHVLYHAVKRREAEAVFDKQCAADCARLQDTLRDAIQAASQHSPTPPTTVTTVRDTAQVHCMDTAQVHCMDTTRAPDQSTVLLDTLPAHVVQSSLAEEADARLVATNDFNPRLARSIAQRAVAQRSVKRRRMFAAEDAEDDDEDEVSLQETVVRARSANGVQTVHDETHSIDQKALFAIACLERRLTESMQMLLDVRNPHLRLADSLLLRDYFTEDYLFQKQHFSLMTTLSSIISGTLIPAAFLDQLATFLQHQAVLQRIKQDRQDVFAIGTPEHVPKRNKQMHSILTTKLRLVYLPLVSSTVSLFIEVCDCAASSRKSRFQADVLAQLLELIALLYKTFNAYLLVDGA